MLTPAQISEVAEEVARAKLTPNVVKQVLAEPTTDSEGHEALRVTIVIEPGAANRIKGDSILDTLVQIQDRLREAGEDRFAIVEYATQDELEAGGDPQS
jgi:hypothetical protein